MRSLHKNKEAKIFKFHDFSGEIPEKETKENFVSPKIPFVVFDDDDDDIISIKADADIDIDMDTDADAEEKAVMDPYLSFEDDAIKLRTEAPVIAEVPYLMFDDEDFFFRRAGTQQSDASDGDTPEDIIEIIHEPEQIEELVDPTKEMADKIIREAEQEAEAIIEKAQEKAQKTIDEANETADDIKIKAEEKAEKLFEETKEEAYKTGYDEGLAKGSEDGKEQATSAAIEKHKAFFEAVDRACEEIDKQKEESLEQGLKDLTELSLAVSEKVISVALDTCGEVVKRMILSAAAEATEKHWAKITVSAKDVGVMEADGINIGNELYSVSDRIDLIIVDDAESGTCLVEFPDQAIDAGMRTQLENIRAALYED